MKYYFGIIIILLAVLLIGCNFQNDNYEMFDHKELSQWIEKESIVETPNLSQSTVQNNIENLVFKISHLGDCYTIEVLPDNVTRTTKVNENHYELTCSSNFADLNSIELTGVYSCTVEQYLTQVETFIGNYLNSSTIFGSESFSYGSDELLVTYIIQKTDTMVYYQVCYLHDIENELLFEFLVELGDLESLRTISAAGTVKDLFSNIKIEKDPYSQIN